MFPWPLGGAQLSRRKEEELLERVGDRCVPGGGQGEALGPLVAAGRVSGPPRGLALGSVDSARSLVVAAV